MTSYREYEMECEQCKTAFIGIRSDTRFCSQTCANASNNAKAKRLSLKLKPEQLEEILRLQDAFLRRNANSK